MFIKFLVYDKTNLRTFTELHREITETHRVKKSDLCGPPWFSVDLSRWIGTSCVTKSYLIDVHMFIKWENDFAAFIYATKTLRHKTLTDHRFALTFFQ